MQFAMRLLNIILPPDRFLRACSSGPYAVAMSSQARKFELASNPRHLSHFIMNDETEAIQVTMFVEKSSFFRVVHADGTLCALSPAGNVCLTFYNDRAAFPKEMVEGVNGEGFVTGEIREKRNEPKGYARELETQIVMSKEVAMRLWRRLGEEFKLPQG
jgi:hypothetical protein